MWYYFIWRPSDRTQYNPEKETFEPDSKLPVFRTGKKDMEKLRDSPAFADCVIVPRWFDHNHLENIINPNRHLNYDESENAR